MSGRRVASLASVVALTWATAVLAQNVSGSIQGTVKDPDGAILPGAQVVVRNVGTSAGHERTADAAGRYQVPLLPPGEYEVHFSLAGFGPVARRGIRLTVGLDAVVDATLSLGQRAEEVVVQAEISGVNLTSGAVSGLVSEKEIRDLPLNGRSFQQLALLQPGVNAALTSASNVVGGRTPKITINGARPEHNNFLLDGTDINNVYNKTPGSVAGVLLGVDAVQEFQVLTNAYSAEFGRSAGGVINAVTRSGTNDFHGSAFEFHRNSALDARNYFDPPSRPKPEFWRHQFGATLGGPVVKDRTFFFLAYEGLVERLGVTGVALVPDDNARRGILPNRTVALHPAIPAYLDLLFPPANGRNLGGGIAEYVFSVQQPTSEHFLQARLDHRLSPSDSVFLRYTYDFGSVDRQFTDKVPISFVPEQSRNHYATLEHQHTFSGATLNLLRLGFARSVNLADNQLTVDVPQSMFFVPQGDRFGFMTVRGMFTELGGDIRLRRNDRYNNFQLGDTFILNRRQHSLRLGFQVQHLQFDQDSTSQLGGVLNFPNLESFLQGRATSADLSVPGLVDPFREFRQWFFGAFVQDDVRLGSRLAANIGLRYELVTVPTETSDKISNLRNVSDSQLTVGGPWHSNPSLKNLAPRLGLAWDPFGSGKTSVRAGFGVFYDEILPKYYVFSGSLNPPFTTRTTINNPPFPNITADFDPNRPIKPGVQTVKYDLATPFIMQYNLNVQRSFGDLDLMVGYVGSRGKNLIRLGDANLAPETTVNGVKVYQPQLGRRNPNFAGIWQRVTDAESFYNSLQVSLQKRYRHGWRAQLSYTLSRSVDDSSGINSQDFGNNVQYGLDWYDPQYDRGLSAFHAKHNLTFNWTWDVPLARHQTGVVAALLKGWQINNITTLRSGHPFTVQMGFNRSGNLNTTGFSLNERPDLKPGCSNNPVLGGPDRYFDVNCFQLPPANQRGNLGRNTLIGPSTIAVDLSLVKNFSLGRDRTLQLRAECFNVPNHPNFAVPSGRTAFTGVNPDGTPIVSPSWGRVTETVTTGRQIQLGLKLLF